MNGTANVEELSDMGRILSYVMFGFFVCTTIMSASVLRSREKLKINNILFALVCIGSSIWSFCFGFIWIQTDPLRAYYWLSLIHI